MSAAIHICSKCQGQILIEEHHRGVSLQCPHCSLWFLIAVSPSSAPLSRQPPPPVPQATPSDATPDYSRLPVHLRRDQLTYAAFRARLFCADEAFESYQEHEILDMYSNRHRLALRSPMDAITTPIGELTAREVRDSLLMALVEDRGFAINPRVQRRLETALAMIAPGLPIEGIASSSAHLETGPAKNQSNSRGCMGTLLMLVAHLLFIGGGIWLALQFFEL